LITENTHRQQVDAENQTGNVVRDEAADAGAYYNPVPGNVSQSTYTAFRGDNISQLVAWHSGRTSVSGRRTFPVLRSTCS